MGDLGNEASARERLLEVATSLFVRHGFAGTPVSMIVREANVSMPVLYYHFGNKVELLRAVIEARGEWIRSEFKLDPSIGFDAFCVALIDHALAHLDDLRDGLRLRFLLAFEAGEEIAALRVVSAEQRQRSIIGIGGLFADAMPGITERRSNWLAEIFLSGVQALALDAMGPGSSVSFLPEKSALIKRNLKVASEIAEDDLPEG